MEKLVIQMDLIPLTVISPCYNESGSVRECIERTLEAVGNFDSDLEFEHIFIDNSSTDKTVEVLSALKMEFPHIRILQNSENIGVFRSIRQAILKSRGRYVIPFLASDNQDPPEMIAEMLTHIYSGEYDSVFGVRKTRLESNFLLLMRKIFYKMLNWGLGGNYQSGASEYCIVKRDVAIKVASIEDNNPFLRIYLSKLQGKVKYIDYQMDQRKAGASSANIFTLVDDALNAFSIAMPSIFSRVLVLSSVISFCLVGIGISTFLFNLFFHKYSLVILTIVSLVSSVGLLTIGYLSLIGHYLFILHSEIRKTSIGETTEL